jgi:Fur family zinc uptake transcriptional regulator
MQTRTSFGERTDRLLDRAATTCDRRGSRLTEIRRHVLGLVLESEVPAGAYELLEQLRASHKGAAPPTVYRALDFLLDQGLIHKVERLSAFVGCVHDMPASHEEDAHHWHGAQFLICQRCNRTVELDDRTISSALAGAAGKAGFVPHRATVEIEGLCAACVQVADRDLTLKAGHP